MLANILNKITDIELVNFIGGTKFNVIPASAKAIFCTSLYIEDLKKLVKESEQILKEKFNNISINIQRLEFADLYKHSYSTTNRKNALDKIRENINSNSIINSKLNINESKRFLQNICNFPHGVLNKNERGEVTTSINLGVVNIKENEIKVGMRSSRKEEEKICLNKLKEYCKDNNFVFNIIGSQPSFRTGENAEIVRKLIKAHPDELFKTNPNVKSMHITVEVGFFQEKIPDIQIAIISPNIQGAHTPKECVEIASIERNNIWIENFLEKY